MIHFELIFIQLISVQSSTGGYPVFPVPLVKGVFMAGTFADNQMDVAAWVYI
jgi:hypothetical protein